MIGAWRRVRTGLPWLLCGVSLLLLAVGAWLQDVVPQQDPDQPWVWLEQILFELAVAGIPLVGALIASRHPSNPYGWLWCAIGLDIGVGSVVEPLAWIVGAPAWVAALVSGYTFVVLVPLLVLSVLLFPTGRVPSPRWRWLTRAVVAVPVLLMLVGPFVPVPDDPAAQGPWALQGAAGRLLHDATQAAILLLFAFGLVALSALVMRYRRAAAVERQQLTWFVYAAVLAVVVLVGSALKLTVGRPLSAVLGAVVLGLFPVAVGVAVLRYRLYEIDRIVSRTVTYGLLTAAIFAVYLLVVGVLSQLGVPDGSSDVVVAIVTLSVAAFVGRVRRRLQTAVDRRFDRARYDAGRAVDAFAARLQNQVDLDEITAGLRDTVAATVAPGRVAVWLRPADRG